MHMDNGIFDEAICDYSTRKRKQIYRQRNVTRPTMHASDMSLLESNDESLQIDSKLKFKVAYLLLS